MRGARRRGVPGERQAGSRFAYGQAKQHPCRSLWYAPNGAEAWSGVVLSGIKLQFFVAILDIPLPPHPPTRQRHQQRRRQDVQPARVRVAGFANPGWWAVKA